MILRPASSSPSSAASWTPRPGCRRWVGSWRPVVPVLPPCPCPSSPCLGQSDVAGRLVSRAVEVVVAHQSADGVVVVVRRVLDGPGDALALLDGPGPLVWPGVEVLFEVGHELHEKRAIGSSLFTNLTSARVFRFSSIALS